MLTVSSSSTYHHGNLRRALMEAGVSQAAPYHHFADKGALLSAIAEQGYLDLAAALRAGAERAGGNALAGFQGMGIAYVRFAVDRPSMFRLLFRRELRATAAPGGTFAATAAYRVLEEGIAAAIREGSVSGSKDDIALAAWCVAHGAARLIV